MIRNRPHSPITLFFLIRKYFKAYEKIICLKKYVIKAEKSSTEMPLVEVRQIFDDFIFHMDIYKNGCAFNLSIPCIFLFKLIFSKKFVFCTTVRRMNRCVSSFSDSICR